MATISTPPSNGLDKKPPSKAYSAFPGNFLGMSRFHFFGEVLAHVDRNLDPSFSPWPRTTVWDWFFGIPTLLFITPNAVWTLYSIVTYFLFPYDFSAATAPLNYSFFVPRFIFWLFIQFSYVGFWHVSLYGLDWAKRPFIQNRPYNFEKVAHNIFWNISACFIWASLENLFVYLWSTGRIDYISDTESFSSSIGILRFIIVLNLVPVWRTFHFYFAHRFLHFAPLYSLIHSIHHRNTDIEPFAGHAMHPIEHLCHFASVLPCLLFALPPIAFQFIGVYLLLSPAASHSGWEDHWQADAYHYLHHRYFECNYAGADAVWFDVLFGTFQQLPREKAPLKLRADAKSTLRSLPSISMSIFSVGCASFYLLWAYYAFQVASLNQPLSSKMILYGVSFLVGFGPLLFALLLSSFFFAPSGGSSKTGGAASLLLHVLIGVAICAMPLSYLAYLTLIPE